MKPYGFVYETTNHVTGKKYIGICSFQDSLQPKTCYLGSGKILRQAIKKYGRENFTRKIIQECDSYDELAKAEQAWIQAYNAVESAEYYNISSGGYGGNSKDLKKYWAKYTKEERKSLRKWSNRSKRGKNNPMWGKTHSQETKRKIGS